MGLLVGLPGSDHAHRPVLAEELVVHDRDTASLCGLVDVAQDTVCVTDVEPTDLRGAAQLELGPAGPLLQGRLTGSRVEEEGGGLVVDPWLPST